MILVAMHRQMQCGVGDVTGMLSHMSGLQKWTAAAAAAAAVDPSGPI
jgi:hypothetical protein